MSDINKKTEDPAVDAVINKKKRKKKVTADGEAVKRTVRLDENGNPVRKKRKRPAEVRESSEKKTSAEAAVSVEKKTASEAAEKTRKKKIRLDENGNPVRKKRKRPAEGESLEKKTAAEAVVKDSVEKKTASEAAEKTRKKKIRLDENGNPVRKKRKRPAEGEFLEKKTAAEAAVKDSAEKKTAAEAAVKESAEKNTASEGAEKARRKKVRLDENGRPVRNEKRAAAEGSRKRDGRIKGAPGSEKKSKTPVEKDKKQKASAGAQIIDFFTKPATGNKRTFRLLVIADIVLLVFLIIVLSVRHYKKEDTRLSGNPDVTSVDQSTESGESSQEEDDTEETDFQASDTITILGAGDNLIHSPIYEYAETSDGYDFTYCYEKISDQISAADIATINQETPLATSVDSPSGYPRFNTPTEAGEALIDAGFDIFGIGNNHFADMGADGVTATLNFFENAGVPYVGVYWDEDDRDTIRVIESNGIKVAFLNFFSFVNQEIPLGYQFVMLDEPDRVKAQIDLAKEQADIVVVHAHWGEEYQTQLTEQETEMAQNMVNWGADIIFGNHPHVLQELTVLTREDDGQKCPVIYSLGNFISGQQQKATMVGGLLTVTVGRDEETGEARPTAMEFDPVVTQFTEADGADAQVIPLSDYTEEMADAHGILNYEDDFTVEYIENLVSDLVPDEYNGKMGSLS
ncbi:MAG: CapA family protein [Lachnospiraceae bacterium]|nr:CapA family protein [Lachnospiraceae bacterium]